MKKILFVAPHSFPIKSSESICNAKVAYALSEAGYRVDVYTCDETSTYPSDKELTKILSSAPNLRIITVKADYIIQRRTSLYKLMRSLLYNLKIIITTGFFYNGISIPHLILKEIIRRTKNEGFDYDLLITRGFNTDLVGVELVKKFGIKWIANWNDPYPVSKFPAPYGKGCDAKLPYFENRIYNSIQKYATLHTFPNDRLRDYMLTCFKHINDSQTAIIPHMALSRFFKKNSNNDEVLSFIHCGDLKYPRSPKEFLKALAKYLNENPNDRAIVQCNLIGGLDHDIPSLIRELNLHNNVLIGGGLSYKDALQEISKCNISLIIEAKCEEGIYLPTKVVDSLQSGVPIFAISPQRGVLRDYITKYNIGYYAQNDSEISIFSQLSQIINDFKISAIPKISPDSCPQIYESSILQTYKQLIDNL